MLGGAGSRLPTAVLAVAGVSTVVAVVVSATSIYLQLKNYRKPALQRMVIRIMLMVPIYAVASLIALFSLEAAFVIDAIRDIYEAFVIYCFFVLLLSYLGGERSLLILLHGRPPKVPPFPVNIFKRELDVSDPYTFLFLKRGILQYVQIKPILAIVTLILKACGVYNEGNLRANSGYLYVSIIYNLSITVALYCLAMFWLCVNDDLKPFRPVPKFLCVKGVLFFSFWQSFFISILVAAGAITKLGPYTDSESISVGLTDTLICIEMPFFAFAHLFAFAYTDFLDPQLSFVARMPVLYALRDSFGHKDVLEDSKATLRGEGMDYREFEPSEGFMHQGDGRTRRIRAGLRYVQGGKGKYWLPKPDESTLPGAISAVMGGDDVHAPLLGHQADDVVHLAPDLQSSDILEDADTVDTYQHRQPADGYDLPFGDLDDADEDLFKHSTQYLFGDYNYPVIDCSSEQARAVIWDEEERVLRDERGAWFSPIRGNKGQLVVEQRQRSGKGAAWEGYGAVGTSGPRRTPTPPQALPPHRDERLIDYDQDRTPAPHAQPHDVRLKWTRAERDRTTSGSRPHSATRTPPHNQSHTRPTAVSSGSSGSVEKRANAGWPWSISTTPPSRTASRSGATPGGPTSPIVKPDDAVDLIVEAPSAPERTNSGTPGGGGLKRIYGSGPAYSEGHDPKQKEDEIVEAQKEELEREDEGGGSPRLAPSNVLPDAEREIVREVDEPPIHVRTFMDTDDDNERNPWA